MSVTFETSVWERDWQQILCTPLLREMIARCHYPFERKRLYINNVENSPRVQQAAAQLVSQGVIDEYTLVADHADEALEHFKLSRQILGRGYFYSIQLLVSVYLTNTSHLLHFSGDSIADPQHQPDWLTAGLSILHRKPEIKVFNLTWNHRYWEANLESDSQDDDFYYGYGFSDQMYFIRTNDFKTANYNELHPASARYPAYGGESFEKRVLDAKQPPPPRHLQTRQRLPSDRVAGELARRWPSIVIPPATRYLNPQCHNPNPPSPSPSCAKRDISPTSSQ